MTTDRRLDRLVDFDPASRRYQIRTLLETETAPRLSKDWEPGAWLDQGQEGACVSFGIHHCRACTPLAQRPVTNEMAFEAYHAIQHRDPWPGCALASCTVEANPSCYEGTSVRSGMMYGVEMGWWPEVRWVGAGSGRLADDIVDTWTRVGGIVFGTQWLESMFAPDANGVLRILEDSGVSGGHCWFAPGFRYAALPGFGPEKREYAVGQNSWGEKWGASYCGHGGFFYLPLEDGPWGRGLIWLLEQQGEGAVPIIA